MSSEGLAHLAGKGALWSGVGRFGVHGIDFATTIIMARVLGVQEFGLIAIALVVIRLSEVVTDAGLVSALVYKRDVHPDDWRSALILNCAVGSLLGLTTILGANAIGAFFSRPELASVIRLLGLYFPLRAVVLAALASYWRELDYAHLVRIELVAALTGSFLALAALALGAGAQAVAVQHLGLAAMTAIFLAPRSWSLASDGKWSSQRAKELWKYGRGVVGFAGTNFAARNADDVLIGRFVGSAELGVYNRAYALMLLPVGQVARVLDRVMLPALSQLSSDVNRFRSAYIRATRVVGLIGFPLFAVSFVLADSLVHLLLGPAWIEVIPIFRILALAGCATVISTTTGWIFQASGQTGLLFRWGVVSSIFTVISFGIGVLWGVIGVATAYLIRSLILLPFSVIVPGKKVGISFSYLARSISREVGLAVLLGVGALGGKLIGAALLASPFVEFLLGLLGATLTFAAAVTIRPTMSYLDAKSLILGSASRDRGFRTDRGQ